MTKWMARLAPALVLALCQLTLMAQAPSTGSGQAPSTSSGQALNGSWADEIIKQDGYATPPPELAEAVLAPRHLNVTLSSISPDKKWFVDEIGDGPVLMKTFSKPFHELGGVFIDYKANRARALTIRNNAGLQIISAADGTKRPIQLPAGARVSNPTWSPDSASIAFFVHGEDATHIYVADVATGKARQLTKTPVLATMTSLLEFTDGGRQIATIVAPEGRAPMPAAPTAPTGPTVKIASEGKSRLRTFASLMSTAYEKQLLKWHATGQIALVDAQKGTVRRFGKPDMIRSVDFAPDGKFARVTRMVEPFSYDVPVNNFGSIEEIWDAEGKPLAKLNERELNLGIQDDDDPPAAGGGRGNQQNQPGKRELAWRLDGQGLTYLEQEAPPETPRNARGNQGARQNDPDDQAEPPQRGGRGAGQQAQRPDRLYQWLPPFDDSSKKVVFEHTTRMSGHRFSPDMKVLFFSERAGQNSIDKAVYLDEPTKQYTLARYRSDDIYANPGSIVGVRGGGGGGGRGGGRGGGGGGAAGSPVLLSADSEHVFYQGTAYAKDPNAEGPKTFIDKVAIKTGTKTRIYESPNNGIYERVSTILDPDAGRFIVTRESPTEVPQQYLVQNGQRTQLTQNVDVTPDLTQMKVERFVVERPDGFKFRVTVNLPKDFTPGSKPPALFWFYPREYQSQESYDRPDRTFNRNSFPNFGVRSMEFFTRLGYAVVEPDAPIVGQQGAMNDNYVHDLRNNLAAVIDELDRRGLADRSRLAIGGHSYGAFSTVNAMVHTPFFKAGIAGDGAYNRTLTPLGFQSERRDLWQAPHVYLGMSPFLYAQNLTGALLMYHGYADQNVGTDPDNSIRLYHALNGLGKTTALYMYPLEDHGPASRETLLDLWARWAAWLDKYVKNPQKAEPAKKITTQSVSR